MQRRQFIKSGLLTGLGVVLGTTNLLATNQTNRIVFFELPKAQKHIRHGLFQQNKTVLLNGLGKIQRDVFLNATAGDLIHFSIELENSLLSLGVDANTIYVTTPKGIQQYELAAQQKFSFAVSTNWNATLINLKSKERTQLPQTTTAQESILIPIRGESVLDNTSVDENMAAYMTTTTMTSIESKKGALLLLLQGQHRF